MTGSFLNSQRQCYWSVDLEGCSEQISSHHHPKDKNTRNSANTRTGAGLVYRKHGGCGSRKLGSKSWDTADYMVWENQLTPLGKSANSCEPSSLVVRGGRYQLHKVAMKIR